MLGQQRVVKRRRLDAPVRQHDACAVGDAVDGVAGGDDAHGAELQAFSSQLSAICMNTFCLTLC